MYHLVCGVFSNEKEKFALFKGPALRNCHLMECLVQGSVYSEVLCLKKLVVVKNIRFHNKQKKRTNILPNYLLPTRLFLITSKKVT
jgi:hypothetical protein